MIRVEGVEIKWHEMPMMLPTVGSRSVVGISRSFQLLAMTMKTATSTPAASAKMLYLLFSLSTAGSRWEAPT
jgi:hypothetical protein